MLYQTLDAIADSYTPGLFILVLASYVCLVKKDGVKAILSHIVFLAISLIYAYSFIALDSHFHLWESLGLDYSSHTSVSIVFAVALYLLHPSKLKAIVASLLIYALLMLYQEYHSLIDIVTTTATLPVLLLYIQIQKYIESRRN